MNFRASIAAALLSGPNPQTDSSHRCEFRFAANDPTFSGHFPTRPILPGVFQIEIARFAAELAAKQPLRLREVTKAKFLRPIIPDETVRVELKLAEQTDMIQVRASFSVTGQPAGEVILQATRNS